MLQKKESKRETVEVRNIKTRRRKKKSTGHQCNLLVYWAHVLYNKLVGEMSIVQLSEEIRACNELIKAVVHPFNHFVIHRFKSHLWAVIAGISCHNISVTGKCLPHLDQLMLDSALSLAGSRRLIFH